MGHRDVGRGLLGGAQVRPVVVLNLAIILPFKQLLPLLRLGPVEPVEVVLWVVVLDLPLRSSP